MNRIVNRGFVDRISDTIKCDCGKDARRVPCTQMERKKYKNYGCWSTEEDECCARAFSCECGARILGTADWAVRTD